MSVKSASLKSYILRRVLQSIPLIFAVIIFNFIIIHLAPSDPAVLLAGEFTTPEWLEKTRNYFGLTKPLHEQLTIYVFNVVRGDFGYSFYHMQPVMDVIIARVPVTLLLMVTQLVFASIAGILLGAISARKPYSFTDNASSAVALVGWSVPSFWLGMMFIMFFSLQLGWFPVQGVVTLREELTGLPYVLDVLHHLTLPAFTLSLWTLAIVFRQTRASVMEQLWQDYIVTARSKGLSEKTIVFKHALKNASIPVITVVSFMVGWMFAGAILVETVFAWPGLGRLIFEAIITRDYPLIMGMVIIVSVIVIIVNIITDIIYSLIDPRIRYR